MLILANLCMAAAALVISAAHAQDSKEGWAELILTNLPPRGSQAYKNLLALAGKEAWGQIQPYTQSEVWSMPRSRIENVQRQAERLGVKTTILGADWNHILKIPTAPVAVSRTQESIVKSMQGRKETTGVNVMTSPIAPMVDYALHKNEGKRVNAVRPGAAPSRIVIPLNENESITVRRTAVEKKKDGCTWRGEIEGTGEPVILMWWKTGRFSGMFTYRGRTYLLKNIGGEVHAIVETDPGKMPPDHAPREVTQGADVKDDPLVARGEGVTMRARDGANVKNQQDLICQMFSFTGTSPVHKVRSVPLEKEDLLAESSRPIEPLSAAKRREMALKSITIDAMVLYTSRAASNYIEIETDLLALSIEQANVAFSNSDLPNIKLRLVHSQVIDYDDTEGEHFGHLYRMVDGVGAFSKVRLLRNEKRADVVVLIVDDASGCGLATRVAAGTEEAFAVVHHSCAALSYSLAHEVGHIIGARHYLGLDKNMSPFPYGHGYVNGTKWRDIMSYKAGCGGCPRLPFFSNPTIKIRGEPGGAMYMDNARVVLEQAQRVSKFR